MMQHFSAPFILRSITMKHITRLMLSASMITLLTSCASTTIYPGENGTYSSVTTSREQAYAEKDAAKKAEEYCRQQGKNYIVVNHQTKYQGADKTDSAMIGLASAMFTGGSNPAKSNEDYQVTMTFKCR
jgi:hypothetical protein